MKLDDFADQVFAVAKAIAVEFSANPFQKSLELPKGLTAVRAALRNVASDLILCSDVNEAITRLKRDQAGALLVAWVATQAKNYSGLAIKRAHVATSHEPTVLPLHAFCSYLIELSDLLEPAPQNPEGS